MKRVLDELADALHTSQRLLSPRTMIRDVKLRQQFQRPITPKVWRALAAQLTCILPPLQRSPRGEWLLPRRCNTIWELASFVANQHPDWQPPCRFETKEWQEAQVFVGVRACLVDALNVESEEVVRSARLQGDLGAD